MSSRKFNEDVLRDIINGVTGEEVEVTPEFPSNLDNDVPGFIGDGFIEIDVNATREEVLELLPDDVPAEIVDAIISAKDAAAALSHGNNLTITQAVRVIKKTDGCTASVVSGAGTSTPKTGVKERLLNLLRRIKRS